jgi:hypothetical protein
MRGSFHVEHGTPQARRIANAVTVPRGTDRYFSANAKRRSGNETGLEPCRSAQVDEPDHAHLHSGALSRRPRYCRRSDPSERLVMWARRGAPNGLGHVAKGAARAKTQA